MTALIFPGQGSQEPGMGREFYSSEVFAAGSRVAGRDLAALCQSDAETLSRTENAQLAVFAVSMAMYAAWAAENGRPAAMAGFSLGECSALCAAGVLSLEDGFRLVQKRAELMQASCRDANGAMSALLGGEPPQPYEDGEDWAVPVNFNCPGQTVIAGTPGGVAALEAQCKASGGRAARLALSGAFHTKMMSGAGEMLKAFAATLAFSEPAAPLYTNLSGEILHPGADVPRHLELHMTHPVLWQKCVENMLAAGVTRFVEMGHGSSLAKLIKRIDRGVEVSSAAHPAPR
ncbi:MAG: ACP S-malonyltransferase [Oscillospiraceae bacterium]|jgi:[acyl-carrier-protein] S-malonyltransferase|nr:ACP S-malonyltransferase [Oscillospiraceae bacterium]